MNDDDGSIEMLREPLVEVGFVVETATSGLEALAKLESFSPDVLVMDVEMLDLRGPEVVRRARVRAKEIPVIWMTGHNIDDDVVASLKDALTLHVSKPVDIDELVEAIRALKGSAWHTDGTSAPRAA